MLQVGLWKTLVYHQPDHHNNCNNWSPKQNAFVLKVLLLHVSLKKNLSNIWVIYAVTIFLECLADTTVLPNIALKRH